MASAGPGFGFGLETALAAMRLVLSGAFDAFPGLKVILGHLGEGLPFLMQRMDWPFDRPHVKADKSAVVSLARKPSSYFLQDFMVTTSGNYLPAAFKCTREAWAWTGSCSAPTIPTKTSTKPSPSSTDWDCRRTRKPPSTKATPAVLGWICKRERPSRDPSASVYARAATPVSPVRMRRHSSISRTKILPSPMLPVRAPRVMASTVCHTLLLLTAISILIL